MNHPNGLTSVLNEEMSKQAHQHPFACGKVGQQNIGGNVLKYSECSVRFFLLLCMNSVLPYIIIRQLCLGGVNFSKEKKPPR